MQHADDDMANEETDDGACNRTQGAEIVLAHHDAHSSTDSNDNEPQNVEEGDSVIIIAKHVDDSG